MQSQGSDCLLVARLIDGAKIGNALDGEEIEAYVASAVVREDGIHQRHE